MKTKNLNKGAMWLCIVLGLFAVSSCTKDFKKYNTNPNALTEEQLKGDFQDVGAFFPDMEVSVMRDVDWEYQVQQNLNGDVYSGYMMSGDPFLGNKNNLNYYMVPDWNHYPFDEAYQHVMANWLQVKKRAQALYPHLYAVGTIIKVESMHRVTDVYGPIPYTQFASSAFSIPYDSQQAVYKSFFAELDTAITTLSTYVKDNPGATPFAKFDLVYGGDYKKWIKFANTLRLRLAMRLAYADPATAKIQAEAAVANPGGLLSDAGDGALVNSTNGVSYINPLNTITTSWSDISMGAPMESILAGYNDPRLSKYFLVSSVTDGKFKGIRNGIDIPNGSQYLGFSRLNVSATAQLQWMSAAESYFLRAEGALRGWNMGGDAVTLYNQGITVSFAEKGASGADAYVADATSTAMPYVDPTNPDNNVPAGSPYLNDITIKYNAGDGFEKNLQRIITQKWIAVYPDGQEAWSEFRRTGYPKLFPVVVNNSEGAISTSAFIRRLPFPSSELSNNATEVAKGVTLLGGSDNGGTKLWWDKK